MELRNTNFYDIAGILIPGTVTLYFVARQQAELQMLLNAGAVTVGGAVIFLALAYATGHLVAALSNLVEPVLWLGQGNPLDWPRRGASQVLSETQIDRLQSLIRRATESDAEIRNLDKHQWAAHYAEIYRFVMREQPGRTLMFNAIYGMSRGLCLAFALISVVAAIDPDLGLRYAAGFLAVAALFAVRARRFGTNLAREVLVNYLVVHRASEPRVSRFQRPAVELPVDDA